MDPWAEALCSNCANCACGNQTWYNQVSSDQYSVLSSFFPSIPSLILMWAWLWIIADLREDKQFLIDHPGATPITTAQASYWLIPKKKLVICRMDWKTIFIHLDFMFRFNIGQGEDLKKMIGAAVYIECSSKTQQVWVVSLYIIFKTRYHSLIPFMFKEDTLFLLLWE